MSYFYYKRISAEFVAELAELALHGESIVLLGSRYGGKRNVMLQVHERLRTDARSVVIRIKYPSRADLMTRDEVVHLIREAVEAVAHQSAPAFSYEPHPADDLLEPVSQLADHLGKPITLIVPNVDGMADPIARLLLRTIRPLVQQKKLIVILSGEHDFRNLVHGPVSVFNVDRMFVLLGYDKEAFGQEVERHAHGASIRFEDPAQAIDLLWKRSGGSTYLLRLALWTIVETRARDYTDPNVPVPTDAIPETLNVVGLPGAYAGHILRHATQLISGEWECWSDLKRLIESRQLPIDVTNPEQNTPSTLELAGVAVRDESTATLEFASEWIEQFVRNHYDSRRLGDLYARIGQWDSAFAQYRLMPAEQTRRPLGIEDRTDVAFTVSALNAALHSAASKGIEDVQRLFIRGCCYVLGLRDVVFWRHQGTEWEPVEVEGVSLRQHDNAALAHPHHQKRHPSGAGQASQPDRLEIMRTILAAANAAGGGIFALPKPWSGHALAAMLPSQRLDQQLCVFAGDFDTHMVLTGEREKLLEALLRHFVDAYAHAVQVEHDRRRLYMRTQHIEIINAIMAGLGASILNTGHTLELAAEGLRQLGYRRVLFCMVDSKGERVRAVHYSADDDLGDFFLQKTDWPLNPPTGDLQPSVIYTKEPFVGRDLIHNALAHKDVVQHGKIQAMAIVPILTPENEALGTIHVEREDGGLPTEEEVSDLLAFGKQLAIAIEQSERVNLLQTALDKILEPVLILDRLKRLRYANLPATKLISVKNRWHARNQAKALPPYEIRTIAHFLADALNKNQRNVQHFTGIGTERHYEGEILADSILDWRDETAGAFLHITDQNDLYKMFEAFRVISLATDMTAAMDAVLDAVHRLGHRWGRLYLVDRNDENELVSKKAFGAMTQKALEEFAHGRTRLARSSNDSWLCIVKGEPVVFCRKADLDDGAEVTTPNGLHAYNLKNPSCPPHLAKELNDFWIDFPFCTTEKPLGKLTIQCHEGLTPERFALLKVLCGMTSTLLYTIRRRDEALSEREKWMREARQSIEKVLYDGIGTRLEALPAIWERYRYLEADFPELKAINTTAWQSIEAILKIFPHTMENWAAHVTQPTDVDLIHEIKNVFIASRVPRPAWEVRSTPDSIPAQIDVTFFGATLFELINNSYFMAPDLDRLRIEVVVDYQEEPGQKWVRIRYSDNGPGVDHDRKETIFRQGETRRPPDRPQGTGSGLSMVRQNIHVHKGTIQEVGVPGKGAVFTIRLPLGRPQESV